MKKLIERLKTEYRAQLEQEVLKCPTITKRLVDALNTEYVYADLKIMDAMLLNSFLLNNKGDLYTLNEIIFTKQKFI